MNSIRKARGKSTKRKIMKKMQTPNPAGPGEENEGGPLDMADLVRQLEGILPANTLSSLKPTPSKDDDSSSKVEKPSLLPTAASAEHRAQKPMRRLNALVPPIES